jgi:hypothetical protein
MTEPKAPNDDQDDDQDDVDEYADDDLGMLLPPYW